MRKILRYFLLVALLLHSGCSGAKSTQGGSSRAPAKFDFGRSTTVESLYRVVIDVLNRYGYHRTQLGNTTVIDTDWRHLTPDQDETEHEIVETRHRLEITLVNRRTTAEATLHLTCEGRLDKGPWFKIAPNPVVVRFVEDMQREIKQELGRVITQW
jgi:hypothetical protein